MRQWLPLVAPLLVIAVVVILPRFRSNAGKPEELAELIGQADRLVVSDESGTLFESAERHDRDALKASLRVEMPEKHLHCMCDGTPTILLLAKGQQIGRISNHHAKLIRCNLWASDALLVDAQAFLKWFDDRKIPGPRIEYEAAQEREKVAAASHDKWVAGMPPALKPLWPPTWRGGDPDLAPLRKAMAEQVPDKNDRILVLFDWYGSGGGLWSGCPVYEGVAETLLLDYTTEDLLAAIAGKELMVPRIEGVARLFGGWSFSVHRPDDLRLLPPDLKARLLKHSLESKDEDKRGRAQNAFGG